MQRIDDVTAVAALPALPTDNIGTPGFYTGGNPGASPPLPATRVRFWWLNLVQESLMAMLGATGLAPNKSDSTLVLQAVSIIGRRYNTYLASGAWTCQVGVTRVRVRVWAGGGGGGGSANPNSAGCGGGGAGYAEGVFAVTPGTIYAVTVGAGGAPGSSTGPSMGGSGGASSFGTMISATGGTGGGAGNGVVSIVPGGGGLGYGGALNTAGQSGGNGVPLSGSTISGIGGASGFAGSTSQFSYGSAAAAGQPGVFPGSGAGGGIWGGGGGTGSIGAVIVEY